MSRKSMSKKTRFEVFKRDSFKCQYCGRSAPEVLLHVDHIKPVAEGGTDDILNLITSCADCNGGKGSRPLSDQSAVQKQRAQLEELNQRREQLEMMVEWRTALAGLNEQTVDAFEVEFANVTSGHRLTDTGRREIAKLIRMFGLNELLDALHAAADVYIVWEDETPTQASIETLLAKLGGVARNRRVERDDPVRAYTIRIAAAARKHFGRVPYDCDQDIRIALGSGVPFDEVLRLAYRCTSWSRFLNELMDLTESYKPPRG